MQRLLVQIIIFLITIPVLLFAYKMINDRDADNDFLAVIIGVFAIVIMASLGKEPKNRS